MVFLAASCCFLAAFLLTWCINWVSLIPWRASRAQPWAERARILWPVRRSSAILMFHLPIVIFVLLAAYWEAEDWQKAVCLLSSMGGAMGGSWFMIRELNPEIRLGLWFQELASGVLLRLGLWLILILLGVSMPGEFNLRVASTLLLAVALMVVWPMLSLRILRLFGFIRPAEPRLLKLVDAGSGSQAHRVRHVFQIRGTVANALALPLAGTLLFYDRLLDELSDEEVISIAAHEVGHLAESKWIGVCRYLGSMSVLPLLLIQPLWKQFGIGGVYGAVILMIAWRVLTQRFTRKLERHADDFAREHSSGQAVYAGALEKLYRVNQVPAVLPGNGTTHPHLYDRMLECGVTPGFPRPEAPRKHTAVGWMFLVLMPLMVGWLVISRADVRDRKPVQEHRPNQAAKP